MEAPGSQGQAHLQTLACEPVASPLRLLLKAGPSEAQVAATLMCERCREPDCRVMVRVFANRVEAYAWKHGGWPHAVPQCARHGKVTCSCASGGASEYALLLMVS